MTAVRLSFGTAARYVVTRPLVVAAWAIVPLLGLVPAFKREPHTDESWALHLAGRLLDGARHGVDFIEVNPPLYLWKSLPPVVVSRLLVIPAWHVFLVMLSLLAALSLVLVARVVRRIEPSRGRRVGIALASAFVLLVLPRTEFSQREHLVLALTLPYIFLAASRVCGSVPRRSEALLIGFLGAMGFALKPHFLIPWLLLEIYLAVGVGPRALRRGELGSLVAFGSAYVILILVLTPEYLSMAARLGSLYVMYMNNGVSGAITGAGIPLLAIGPVILASRAVGPRKDAVRDVLGLTYLGFLIAAVAQQKGAHYHYLPAWGLGLLLLMRTSQLIPESFRLSPCGLWRLGGSVLLVYVCGTKLADAVVELARPDHPKYRYNAYFVPLLPVVKRLAAGEAVAVFSTSPSAAWPLTTEAGARPAFRYMSLWPLSALYHDQLWTRPGLVRPVPISERPRFEQEFVNEIVEDLSRHQPKLLLILSPDSTLMLRGASQRIDYLEYFSTDSRFRDFITGYREIDSVGAYRVWAREKP